MAKTMALLDGDTVVNTLWCRGDEPETDTMKEIGDHPVGIGDTYADGHWYRDGAEVLTPLEQAQNDVQRLQEENSTLLDDMAQMVDEVYQSDLEMMGL